MVARWYFDVNPEIEAVQIELFRSPDGRTLANLTPPVGYSVVAEVVALANEPLEVPSALAAGVLLSAREKIHLRITGDYNLWLPEWGALDHVGRTTSH